MAPIDPDQLLKALDSLLSIDGGIKSIEDVPRLASLMKKFSKKLVSRCVYCNVLQATKPDILSVYLEKGGWETINVWLEYAKSSSSPCFLVEMLKLCALLPMTLERLKENNTAKLIKSLTKHDHNEVKDLANELVTKWMSIIKVQKPVGGLTTEKKKKDKKHKVDSSKKDKEKDKEKEKEKAHPPKTHDEPEKNAVKLKGTKRTSTERDTKKVVDKECYEDVKIDPEPLMPLSKKPRPDRPKTAKVYQKKFRSTGLEEETPLPNKVNKKKSTVDKSAAVAAAKSVLKPYSIPTERITEKKLKPETLAAINEQSPSKGIKLIAPKPRPTYTLHESASFMDALISQPVVPVKRKKKTSLPNKANSPTSPTMAPPKLQFYKDTLEMNDENNKKEESEKEDASDEKKEGSPVKEEDPEAKNESNEEHMDVSEEGSHTPPNTDSNDVSLGRSPTPEISKEEPETPVSLLPNEVRSILSHGRRKGKKKSVQWVEEENIKEIFYFEMDETERVNVLKAQNFGDLKSIDLKREKEAIELSKRQAGDRMEEMTKWWMTPVLIDLPPPIVEFGSSSVEKETERIRQQGTLQEIYFTKEMIPDSPHEPDLEIVPPQEPRIIPLDENNQICQVINYSNFERPVPASLPDALNSLLKSGLSLPPHMLNNLPEQMPHNPNLLNQPIMDPMMQHNGQHLAPYDPEEPVQPLLNNGLMGVPPPNPQNPYGSNMHEPPRNMGAQNEWRTLDMVQDQYYNGGFPGPNNMNPNMMPLPDQAPGMNMRPRMMHDNFRPGMHKGPPRGMGPRGRVTHRVPCRHFMQGSCRFGIKCSFLHPGVNGPPL